MGPIEAYRWVDRLSGRGQTQTNSTSGSNVNAECRTVINAYQSMQLAAPGETPDGSGASADNSLRSAAEALKGTLVNDGKRLEIRHFCFAACGSSVRQEVFAGPKSLDAPEPRLSVI